MGQIHIFIGTKEIASCESFWLDRVIEELEEEFGTRLDGEMEGNCLYLEPVGDLG